MGENQFFDSAAEQLSRVPVQWVKHRSNNAANPCILKFISVTGFDGYGRFWRLVELLSDSPSHAIPREGEKGYKTYLLGLNFNDATEFESFIETLIEFDLAGIDAYGRRIVPLVEESALDIGKQRLHGSKGGKTASANRKRKQVQQ